jgi:hypothetical protein
VFARGRERENVDFNSYFNHKNTSRLVSLPSRAYGVSNALLNFEQLQRIFFFQAALLAALFQATLQASLLKLSSS